MIESQESQIKVGLTQEGQIPLRRIFQNMKIAFYFKKTATQIL
jgi:hypothetical protein